MKGISIITALLLTVPGVMAWGPHGHMIVSAIAWTKLTPEVRKEVSRLLKENPDYDTWIDGVDEADRDQIAFIRAAKWPDDIKGNDHHYDNSEGNHPSLGAKSARNIGYDDLLQHRYWHFYDTPFSPDHTKLGKPDKVNALTQILLFTNAIKSSSDDSVKSYDIAWLIHLVGDVHQPLHATTRFDKQDRKGDAGGNLVHVCTTPDQMKKSKCRTVLHGFWDGIPGPDQGPQGARDDAEKLPEAEAGEAAVSDPAQWINESFEAAKERVYRTPIGIGDGPFLLTDTYRSDAKTLARKRLALAGARLANLLNQNLQIPH